MIRRPPRSTQGYSSAASDVYKRQVAFEYRALWIQAGLYFLTTCWVYRWQIIQSRKHVIEKYKEYKNK